MTIINRVMTLIFDVLFAPFVNAPGWLSLVVFSIVASFCGLLVYKYTSNQAAIMQVKNRIKASMLAIKLFKDDLRVMFRSCGTVLVCAAKLFFHALLPLAIMIVPFVLGMAQLGLRYQWRPLRPGEAVTMTVSFVPDTELMSTPISLEPGQVFVAETPPVRILSEHEVVWRLRATQPGNERIRIHAGNEVLEKTIDVGDDFSRVSLLRSSSGFVDLLLHPGEQTIPSSSMVRSIALSYPDRESWFCGATFWLLWLIGLSFGAAYLLKPVLHVEF